jgi:hypothetical protein
MKIKFKKERINLGYFIKNSNISEKLIKLPSMEDLEDKNKDYFLQNREMGNSNIFFSSTNKYLNFLFKI